MDNPKIFENDIKIKNLYYETFKNAPQENLKTIVMFRRINKYYTSINKTSKLINIYKKRKIIFDPYHPSFSSDNITNYLNLNRDIEKNKITNIPIVNLSPQLITMDNTPDKVTTVSADRKSVV
jgi:hypothetical protein